MHVGVFLGEFKPDLGGGFTFVNDVTESFFKTAAESGHNFSLFCPPDAASHLRLCDLPNNCNVVDILPRGPLGRMISVIKHVAPVFSLVWTRPCDLERVALAQGVEIMWFVGGFFDTLNMPYISTVWDIQHLTHPWFPEVSTKGRWEYRELFLRRHLRRASGLITGTEVGKHELVSYFGLPANRIHILPHPTPSFALNVASIGKNVEVIEKFGLKREYLLYPAQFWAHKNHINLLLGLNRLIKKGCPVPDLVLVGSDKGNLEFIRSKVIELDLSDKIHFLGFVSRVELIELYKNAKALIYPSFSGPENLPPLEAFALGCPVVASDFPGAREQLGDAAILFDPGIPSEIANAILAISNIKVRDRLIQRGLARAASWTGTDYSRGVLKILDSLEPFRMAWQ